MKTKKVIRKLWSICVILLLFLLLLLTFSLIWTKNNFGNIGFEEIVFHLNMPIEGASEGIIGDYIRKALLPASYVPLIGLIIVILPVKNIYQLNFKYNQKNWNIQVFPIKFYVIPVVLVTIIWCGILVWDANKAFAFCDYMKNQFTQSQIIKKEYISPEKVKITFPEKKRNLIWIYIESGETSAQNRENGGVFEENYIPEMTEIAKENISFSQSELIEGASVAPGNSWTIGALVGQTAGLPLKVIKGKGNSMNEYESFMPGATTLGEILEDEGYHNVFMAGSDFSYGGRTTYFTQHGSYEIWDYYTAIKERKIEKDYYVWWGFEDPKLYTFAKEELLELASENQPFNFSMLTVDTHHQDGYVCELCPNIYEGRYENVWACASKQLDDFVKWIQQQDFYNNTTIVISGDHCSMDSDFYEEAVPIDSVNVRKVYNAFINPVSMPIKEKNREFTTMDMFPSVLASIGVEIEGERLGLGTNLFSAEKTLSETYGNEYLFYELNKKSTYYDKNILYP